ncbi:MATE family efflux transporter [Eggerthella guodeyinii]|uniref:MATE family efflux transporter n=1 Tax=Eggerthella guodeyinii TaxID=2690837 RepID=UPI001EFF50BE|nr:MATE family efflux transporter [Eggerthella guodeyinii]
MDELLIEPEPTERELGTAPIKPLFARYAAITFAGMLAQMVMVVLEGLIIGNGLGPLGLAAVTVILPLELLNLALGGALGMGTAAAAGQRLGSGDAAGAQKVFAQGFWLSAYLLVALSAAIALFAPQIATLLGATADIHADVTAFIRLLMCFYPFCTLGQLLCSLLRTDEKPSLASALAVIASVVSLLWLYVCVYVLQLGFAAAGAYYGMSTGLWFFAILYFQFNKKSTFKVTFSGMKLERKVCGAILWQGLPLFLVQAASLVYTMVINNYLGALGGDPDLAAFAVINGYVIYLLDMLCLSATYGLQPIASFNCGARHHDRLRELVKASLGGTFAILAVACGLVIAFAAPISAFFIGDDPALVELTASHFLPLLVCAPFGFMAQVASAYFQAVGQERTSIVLGICRYLLFAIPLIVALAALEGITGVWWSQPPADLLAAALAVALAAHECRKLKRADADAGTSASAPTLGAPEGEALVEGA